MSVQILSDLLDNVTVSRGNGLSVSENRDGEGSENPERDEDDRSYHDADGTSLSNYRKKLKTISKDLQEIYLIGEATEADRSKLSLFKGMYRSAQPLYERYCSLYEDLIDVVGNRATTMDDKRRDEAKQYYYCICMMADTYFLNNLQDEGTRRNSSLNQSSNVRNRAKLPTISLPTFDGERTKWQHFKDSFTSLVINDPDLYTMDKFHYLNSCLKGSASAIIAQIPLSEANFNIAWQALNEQYDNQRLLASAYLDKLFNMKTLTYKPSTEQLTLMISQISEWVGAFNQMDIRDRSDFLIFYLVRRCLDAHTKEAFELHQDHSSFPSYQDLIKFLRQRCMAGELASGMRNFGDGGTNNKSRYNQSSKPTSRSSQWKHNSTKTSLAATTVKPKDTTSSSDSESSRRPTAVCPACKGQHLLFKCIKFNNMTPEQRSNCLQNWNGCRLCLFPSHTTRKCSSRYRCRLCRGRHHWLLHLEDDKRYANNATKDNNGPSTSAGDKRDTRHPANVVATSTVLSASAASMQVILGTAVCSLIDSEGQPHTIRLVLDSGSQFSFLSRDVATRLGLNVRSCAVDIVGIGQTPFTGLKGRAYCRLVSKLNMAEVSTQALVVDNITSELPSYVIQEPFRVPYQNYMLADPQFWHPANVDFLLGGDLFSEILTGEIVHVADGQPKLVGTIFGYVVLGRMEDVSEAKYTNVLCATRRRSEHTDIRDDLEKLWELEDPPVVKTEDPLDKACEELFVKTHYRLPTGRYVVRLPFKEIAPLFPSTRWQGVKRLNSIEGKLVRDHELKKLYSEFMEEYESMHHMTKTDVPGNYIIPHHGVVKADGVKKKIRVVFDASARTAIGSLNDYLIPGPKLQNNIVDILISFRKHKIVFTVDLVKMYRQILIHPQDRQYQHILWRSNPSESVQEYQLNTVTYGMSCAPYLALRSVEQLRKDEGHDFPLANEAIKKRMYVDDLAVGANSIEEALELQRQLIEIMKRGEFPLSKWSSNHPQLLAAIDPESRDNSNQPRRIENPEDKARIKILGLQWDPLEDVFSYEVSVPEIVSSKRAILAAVSRIYDPLGLLGPIIIVAKSLIQMSWKLNLSWDQQLPDSLRDKWSSFVKQLSYLSQLKIPRQVCQENATSYDILFFGDASELAYCAAVYLRTKAGNHTTCHLLFSKVKLAPIKTVSIPRLELCAALLATRLVEMLSQFCSELSPAPRIHLFTDSTVVLGWLNTPTYQLQTFVANRVTKILEVSSVTQWAHVRSEDNPSDLGSRGVDVESFNNNVLWFQGPYWAVEPPENWPVRSVQNFKVEINTLPEIKASAVLVALPQETYLYKYLTSTFSFIALRRRFAWIIRFIHNLRNPTNPILTKTLSSNELHQALGLCIKLDQEHHFNQGKLNSSKFIPKQILPLNPFLDEDGVFRVGGRISKAHVPYATRHPYVIPAKSHMARVIISYYHIVLMHPGPSLLLSYIRKQFWIISARDQIRNTTRNCVICRRHNGVPCQPKMADLPAVRLQECHAFTNVGIDFAGPFVIRDSLRRKTTLSKCYLCLFVCLSSRAIHLEAVTSISTSAFWAALERFVSRRGLPTLIWSDNGTNFVGAANQLAELNKWYRNSDTQSELESKSAERGVQWMFNPPYAPHWGGMWEAGVKSAKRLLRSAYGEGNFTYEEIATLFARVEALLNSRPISPMSSDPSDLEALTPGHLLIGRSIISLPERSLFEIKEGRLDRWQLIKQRTQLFWKRWRSECLHEMQIRTKWRTHQLTVQVNDLVLIQGEGTDRRKWPLGRIMEVFPGSDGVVRVATVRTSKGILKRPVTKLISLLPSDSAIQSNVDTTLSSTGS